MKETAFYDSVYNDTWASRPSHAGSTLERMAGDRSRYTETNIREGGTKDKPSILHELK